MLALLYRTIISYKTVGLYIPETLWYFENIDYKAAMSECGVKNSQGKAWPEYSVYLRKSYDFGAWQKGSQACTYIGKLCYDDNYIKPIAISEGTAGLDNRIHSKMVKIIIKLKKKTQYILTKSHSVLYVSSLYRNCICFVF